jgi:hypothetical protein
MRCELELESGSVHINGSTVHDEPSRSFSGMNRKCSRTLI